MGGVEELSGGRERERDTEATKEVRVRGWRGCESSCEVGEWRMSCVSQESRERERERGWSGSKTVSDEGEECGDGGGARRVRAQPTKPGDGLGRRGCRLLFKEPGETSKTMGFSITGYTYCCRSKGREG